MLLIFHFLALSSEYSTCMTRKLPDDHPLEQRSGIVSASAYGVARSITFEYLFSRSLKRGNKSLDDLLSEEMNCLSISYKEKSRPRAKII